MEVNILEFLIIALGTWRLSSLLADEDGPFTIFGRLRHAVGVRYDERSQRYGTNELAKMVMCLWCNSIWLGVVATALYYWQASLTLLMCFPFAISAFAIIVTELMIHSVK